MYVDPSIQRIESKLIKIGVIKSKFSDMLKSKNGMLINANEIKSNRRLIMNLIFLIPFIKANLNAFYQSSSNIDMYTGEVLRSSFGTPFSNLLYFAILVIAYYNIVMRGVIMYCEKCHNLDFMTDLITLEGLSPNNLKRFKFESKITVFCAIFCDNWAIILFSGLYLHGVYTLHTSLQLTLINLYGTASVSLGVYLCSPVVLKILASFYLSTRYITMRYNQNHERLQAILRAKTLDANIALLDAYITTHDILSAKVMRYNEPIKIYLFMFHKIIAAASASVLYLALSGSESIMIQFLMIAIGIQFGFISISSTLIAQLVHMAANDGYQDLCTISAAYGRFYDRRLRFRLQRLIHATNCMNYPIGYSCYNLFPYKNTTTVSFLVSLILMILLIHNTNLIKM